MLKRLLLPMLLFALPLQAQDTPPEIQEGDIMPYLEQVISWNRSVSESESLPDNAREIVLKDRLRGYAKKAVQQSFSFARAQAVILRGAQPVPAEGEPTSRRARIMKAAAEADARVSELQVQLAAKTLTANERQKIQGQIKLAKAQQELLQNMLRIFSADSENSGSLSDQIAALSRTVLDEPQDSAKDDTPAKPPTVIADKSNNEASDDGMLRLSGSLISFSRKSSDLDRLIDETNRVTEANRKLITSLRASLKAALAQGNALAAQDTPDAKSIAEYRQSLDKLLERYKQLSAAVMPLGEMNVTLSAAERSLREWQRLVDDNRSRVFRQLLLRLVVLSVAIAIPLLASELARRATTRYIQDPRRQKQLRLARRIVLGIVLTLVVLANFMSEFGSLATFAGFITAGLAVALQTVLVSLVAHFFFFGRYGVRAGDRITVSGVTGDVVQVGMLRLYLRELHDTDKGVMPTGKIVAFPNSILFQPTAFYKHMNA